MGQARVDDRRLSAVQRNGCAGPVYFLFVVFSSLACAAPVPAPLVVPVPGFPLAATVPDSPPTIPVSVPFLVPTSVAVPGAITGAEEAGVDVLAGGEVDAGALVDGFEAGDLVAAGLRSLQPVSNTNALTNADTAKQTRTFTRSSYISVSLITSALANGRCR